MVEGIRGLGWEFFAGCQSITQSLSQRGWICAPPLDVAYSTWFNLLNPSFVAVVVGIILEERITLVVLDPPLGGPPLLSQAILDVSTSIAKAMFRTGGHVIWIGGGPQWWS